MSRSLESCCCFLSCRCNRGFAIQIGKGKVLQTTHRSPALKLNGRSLRMRRGSRQKVDGALVVCHSSRSYRVLTRDFNIVLAIGRYSSITIAAKHKRALAKSSGMCGGGKMYAAKLYRGRRGRTNKASSR